MEATSKRGIVRPIDRRLPDDKGPRPRTSNEWVLVIDSAVGEAAAWPRPLEAAGSSRFVHYETRLVGHVYRQGLERAEAASELADQLRMNLGGALPFVALDGSSGVERVAGAALPADR